MFPEYSLFITLSKQQLICLLQLHGNSFNSKACHTTSSIIGYPNCQYSQRETPSGGVWSLVHRYQGQTTLAHCRWGKRCTLVAHWHTSPPVPRTLLICRLQDTIYRVIFRKLEGQAHCCITNRMKAWYYQHGRPQCRTVNLQDLTVHELLINGLR